ncbi:MAG: DUF4845 domain-containing protein [Pseudomonadota bacterium]
MNPDTFQSMPIRRWRHLIGSNQSPKRQRGLGALGIILSLIVVACLLLVGLKLFPIYMESIKTDKALQGVIEDPNLGNLSKRDIMLSLTRRLDIDGETRINEHNYKDYVEIKKQRDKVSIDAKWRAETQLFANLSIVADFSKHVQNY